LIAPVNDALATEDELIDKTERTDATFSRSDFAFDSERNPYDAPAAKS
jgi:hypothetical protein